LGKFAGVVMVKKPSIQTLSLIDGKGVKQVQYDFPYLVLMYHSVDILNLYFAYEEVTEKTPLYNPALPNFGSGSTTCFGSVKKPNMEDLSLKELKSALWAVIFKAVYAGHSNTKVFEEMKLGQRIKKYSNNKEMGNPIGIFKGIVNTNFGMNLFDY
jgi:hypothetical protein